MCTCEGVCGCVCTVKGVSTCEGGCTCEGCVSTCESIGVWCNEIHKAVWCGAFK